MIIAKCAIEVASITQNDGRFRVTKEGVAESSGAGITAKVRSAVVG